VQSNQPLPILDQNVSQDEIWSCTTCAACHYQCPIFVEPMTEIVELRRHSVMVKGKMPETAQVAMMSLQKRGHPWTGTPYMRTEWFKDIEVKQLSAVDPSERNSCLLLWVGCTGALVDRNMLVTQAMARVLQRAGIDFYVLGNEELCCGDPARRLGNEFLFQTMAKKNIKILQQYHVETILTTCPHCFNTFKNEYPDFGGDFQVIHHTQFIANLLKEGKLKLGSVPSETITYHDSCYLSRHNDVREEPRILGRAVASLAKVFRRWAGREKTAFAAELAAVMPGWRKP
jgi:Fe-S oxidoreductase